MELLGTGNTGHRRKGIHAELTEYVVLRRHPRATEWSERTLGTAAPRPLTSETPCLQVPVSSSSDIKFPLKPWALS